MAADKNSNQCTQRDSIKVARILWSQIYKETFLKIVIIRPSLSRPKPRPDLCLNDARTSQERASQVEETRTRRNQLSVIYSCSNLILRIVQNSISAFEAQWSLRVSSFEWPEDGSRGSTSSNAIRKWSTEDLKFHRSWSSRFTDSKSIVLKRKRIKSNFFTWLITSKRVQHGQSSQWLKLDGFTLRDI